MIAAVFGMPAARAAMRAADAPPAGGQDVAHGDVFDECGVEPGACVHGAQDLAEELFGAGVFEPAAFALPQRFRDGLLGSGGVHAPW